MNEAIDKNDVPENQGKSHRLPGMPEHVQQFGLCILFHLLLPFLPLAIEAVVSKGQVERKTLLLFLAIYPLSIGVSSRSKLMFGVTIVIGLIYSIFFGLISGQVALADVIFKIAYFCVAAVILIHGCERYNRHVVDREPFWEFG